MDAKRHRLRSLGVAALLATALAAAVVNAANWNDGAFAGNRDDARTNVLISPVPASTDAYAPGELVVGLASDRSVEAAVNELSALGFSSAEKLIGASEGFGAMLLVSTSAEQSTGSGLAEAARELATIPGIDFVQPNYRYATATNANELATDQDVELQRYLDPWSESRGANVAATWRKIDPNVKIDVAVLDTGAYSMEERSADDTLVEANPENYHQEFDGDNLDMAAGRDFVHSGSSESLPLVNEFNPTGDDNGHGTHVSAIIAASTRIEGVTPDKRADGIAGISPNARIVPIKVLDANGDGDVADFVRAYGYLLSDGFRESHNLRVVNMSLADVAGNVSAANAGAAGKSSNLAAAQADLTAGGDRDEGLRNVIRRAKEAGIVTVCAAGNYNPDDKGADKHATTYPSDYEECLSVVALDENGNVADFSYLNEAKDIAAPGTGIYSAWATQADSYKTLDGTSQATAMVSGALTMMWAVNPGLTVDEAKDLLCTSGPTLDIDSDNDGSQALPVLDVAAAVDRASSGGD